MRDAIVGWDIGGANVKAARLDPDATVGAPRAPGASGAVGRIGASGADGGVPLVRERPFALWREPARLPEVLSELARELGPARAAALTMTAELADCFPSKRAGVLGVLDAAAGALAPTPIRVYGTDGRFRSLEEARRAPERVAAANWLASATWLARSVPDALLLDVGSTTTDIVPLVGGRVAAQGRTDTERLVAGELVYTGVLRTTVPALVRRVRLARGPCRVATEHFAIAADAHLWLERIRPEDYTCDTADGRGRSRPETAARLARVVCADPEDLDEGDLTRIARAVVRAQRRRIADGIRQVCERLGADAPRVAVVAGSGARLGAEAARAAGLRVSASTSAWTRDAARAAPAVAVARLLEAKLSAAEAPTVR